MRLNLAVSASICALVVGAISCNVAFAEPTFIRSTVGSATIEREDGLVKKCELFIPLLNVPETVAFRVKALAMGGTVIQTFTIDAMQFRRVSNGIPYEPEKKPITSARVLSNMFDSDKVSSPMDMGDGGMGYKLNGNEAFFSLLKLVGRGDYYVMFKRSDRPDVTAYIVGEKIGNNILRELAACLTAM